MEQTLKLSVSLVFKVTIFAFFSAREAASEAHKLQPENYPTENLLEFSLLLGYAWVRGTQARAGLGKSSRLEHGLNLQ